VERHSEKARAPKVHRTTVARSFVREGCSVGRHNPREKPDHQDEYLERVDIGGDLAAHRPKYFSEGLDLIIANKKFEVPTVAGAKNSLRKRKVRFHLRTRGESCRRYRWQEWVLQTDIVI